MKLAQIDFTEIYRGDPITGGKIAFSRGLTIGEIVNELIPYIYSFIGIVLMIYLILGGFQYMTSRGEPKATEAAKGKITNALIGFLIVFASYWMVQIIGFVLGIDAITNVFK